MMPATKQRYLIWVVVVVLQVQFALAQVDPHFSQYYIYPHFLNPGMTGIMDGDTRVSGIHRNQWNGISNIYATTGISADMTTGSNLNLGMSVLSQGAGDVGFRYTAANFSVAYTGIRWENEKRRHQLTIGLQGGIIARSFDPLKLQLDDQWIPGVGYNPGLPTSDIFPVTRTTVADFGAGIFYHQQTDPEQLQLFGGIAAHHLNRPADPFIAAEDLPYIPLRTTAIAGFTTPLTRELRLSSTLFFIQQGNARLAMAGVHVNMWVTEQTDVLVGTYYRLGDAVIPFTGLRFGSFTVGLSYDITQSALSRLTKGTNSVELSLTYITRRRNSNVPYFNCPRF